MTAAAAITLAEDTTDLQVATRRFGILQVPVNAVIAFPEGLPGFEECRRFALLPVREGIAWLQSIDLQALAFLLARPDRIVPGAWSELPHSWVIITLGGPSGDATANLLAPLVIDPVARQGRQQIAADDRWATDHPVTLDQL
ncbi:MAG: flagellar assembly protein FliW [Gemmatimonadales bacterium]|nr:flagellar assembly protein FliW [Gemmatimonadales bacterium]MDZ4257281.1 flagellar assembly protein FliW [Gemmatimonadales bacterium]MDZ4388970.1 flagellar assembly protein FliW [Gemmatimonadales bacterium]